MFGCIPGFWKDYFRSWPSNMHYVDMNEAYKCLDGIRGPWSCLFEANIYSNLAQISGYSTVVRRVSRSRIVWCVARLEGIDSFTSEYFHPMIVEESFRLLTRFIKHHTAYLLHNLPQISSSMVIQTLVKIIHITIDFVISPASDRIILGLGPQLCIIWIWMKPICDWMVSVDQDHAFWGQHLLQLGTRLGYLTVASRVSCTRVLCCAARLEREDCSEIDSFSFNDSRDVF